MRMILILSLMLGAGTAMARLGESNTEIFKRYGNVIDRTERGTNEWCGVYQFKEYNVVVYFKNNRCVGEVVKPVEHRNFSDAEREALMKSIGGEGEWQETGSPLKFTQKSWTNIKTKALAYQMIGIDQDSLIVATPELVQQFEAAHQQKEKSKAEGF